MFHNVVLWVLFLTLVVEDLKVFLLKLTFQCECRRQHLQSVYHLHYIFFKIGSRSLKVLTWSKTFCLTALFTDLPGGANILQLQV
jgi:hypothetical protein